MTRNISKYAATHTLEKLQSALRRSDTIRGNVTVLRAEEEGEKYTIGEHDLDAAPLGSLTLIVLDANGNGTPPDGTALLVRGEAWVEGAKKRLGVCR